jgi:hypothetical protein
MPDHVLFPLLLTVALEAPIVAIVFREQMARMTLTCLVTTAVTNVVMNTVLWSLASSYWSYIVIGELGAVTIEALVYAIVSRPRDVPRAVLASTLANAVSYGVGVIVF